MKPQKSKVERRKPGAAAEALELAVVIFAGQYALAMNDFDRFQDSYFRAHRLTAQMALQAFFFAIRQHLAVKKYALLARDSFLAARREQTLLQKEAA